jgi:hypothetical protein
MEATAQFLFYPVCFGSKQGILENPLSFILRYVPGYSMNMISVAISAQLLAKLDINTKGMYSEKELWYSFSL